MLTSSFFNPFAILLFIFNDPPIVKASVIQRRSFTHVERPMTWREAQTYCREHHTDLATLTERTFELTLPCRYAQPCWVGLHKDSSDDWSWSDGEELIVTNWRRHDKDRQDVPGKETCVSLAKVKLFHSPCNKTIAVLCQDDLVVVKEKKPWEEALEHCRTLVDSERPESLYTLAHVDIGGGNSEASEAALAAETEEVWVGLRFLAGRWLWVNGKPVNAELPVCPQPGSYCGVMTTSGDLRPENDCSERKNFLCMRRKKSRGN